MSRKCKNKQNFTHFLKKYAEQKDLLAFDKLKLPPEFDNLRKALQLHRKGKVTMNSEYDNTYYHKDKAAKKNMANFLDMVK